MAKYIVEYKMHSNGRCKFTPYFIEDGGYFAIENRKFVGISFDEKEVYLPGDLLILSNQQVINRVKSLELKNFNGENLTDGEKENMANNWLIEKGF